MAQIRNRLKTGQPSNEFEKTLQRELHSFFQLLADIVNNGINFEDNVNQYTAEIADTGGANTENVVPHTLKKIPSRVVITYTDKAVTWYASGTTWTVDNIYLKFNVANCHVKLTIF